MAETDKTEVKITGPNQFFGPESNVDFGDVIMV
jgi:hypothetical protein